MSGLSNPLKALYGMFATYNQAIWPMHIVTYALGILSIILAIKKTKYSDRIISTVLCFLWFWSGIAFGIIFFSRINSIWYRLGFILILQSILFFMYGFGFHPPLSFKFRKEPYSFLGIMMILYALVFYPIVGYLTGHNYPGYPIFGTAPFPVCIFTFGILLITDGRVTPPVLIIPLFWAIGGFVNILTYGIYADIGEVAFAIIGTVMIFYRDIQKERQKLIL